MSLFMMTEIDREDKTTILSRESICISREEFEGTYDYCIKILMESFKGAGKQSMDTIGRR